MTNAAAGLVDDLLRLAERSVRDVEAELTGHDVGRVVEVLLTELVSRVTAQPVQHEKAALQFDLVLGGTVFSNTVVFGAGEVSVEPGELSDPLVWIRQDLAEVLLALFGPPGRRDFTRDVQVAESDTPVLDPNDPFLKRRDVVVAAAAQLLTALSDHRPPLSSLAVRFGSDKWGAHWYTGNYERYFASLRDQRVTVLEIGIGGYADPVGGGASLQMWKHYFRRGVVYGLDIFDKSGIAEARVRPVQGDQGDVAFLTEFAEAVGPFDVIIDDGSHMNADVITSFQALFSHLKPGGLYVVEDTQTAYWPGWGGSTAADGAASTSIGHLKSLVDGLHHQEKVRDGEYTPSETELAVTAVHFHHNMAVVEKGLNTEQGSAAWMPRTEDPAVWVARQFGQG